jgi:MFS family permease
MTRSDIFGRKQIYVFSVLTFLFSSLACALAKTMIQVRPFVSLFQTCTHYSPRQLIIFRAFQGIGGGGIMYAPFPRYPQRFG